MVAQGDWIYFYASISTVYNQSGIMKMKRDGTERTRVTLGHANDINVIGDWIYYIDGYYKLSKVRIDGKYNERLFDYKIYYLTVVGKYAYFVSSDFTNTTGYYRLDLQTIEIETVIEDYDFYGNLVLWVEADRVFILDHKENTISRFFPDTKTEELWYRDVYINVIDNCTRHYYVTDKIYNLQSKSTPIAYTEGKDPSTSHPRYYPSDEGNKIYLYYFYYDASDMAQGRSGSLNLADGSFEEHPPVFMNMSDEIVYYDIFNIYDGYFYTLWNDGSVIRVRPDGSDFKRFN